MVFLTPLFLLGLLAAAIPIAIHLIRREKPPKLMFGSIRFLKKTSKKLVLFQHLQQLFLLALRSLLIALLVMAFARPLVDQTVSRLLDSDPASVVILLDSSLSMHYGEAFERARDEARDIIDDLRTGDEVALIVFGGAVEAIRELTTDHTVVLAAIDSMEEAGYGSTRFFPNLRLADQMLEASRFENRQIYLISDFQEQGVAEADRGWTLAPGVAFTGVDVGVEETSNLALADVRSPSQLLEDETSQEILARVRSTGSLHLERGEATLHIDGQMVDRSPVDLTDQSEQVVSLSAEFASEGSHRGEVRISGDGFEQDNAYYFTVDVLPKINVLLVNGESSDNWYDDEGHWFGLAVNSDNESPFELQTIEPAELSNAALRQNDVVVLLNVGDLSASQAGDLTTYVREGGSVLFAPGDRVDAGRFNEQFSELSPALLTSPQIAARNDYWVIADFDNRHPILQPLDSDWSVRFQGHWAVEANSESATLMRFDSTEPAFLEREVGEGRALLFASAMDLEWNNLPLQGLFLPFIHETLSHLVQPPIKQRAYAIGETVSFAAEEDAQIENPRDSDGSLIDLAPGTRVFEAQRPGFINVGVNGVLESFAVNVSPEESIFTRTPVAALYDDIVNADTQPAQSRAVRTAELIEELEGPQRIWWWILCLVMLLFLAEGLIANRTYR